MVKPKTKRGRTKHAEIMYQERQEKRLAKAKNVSPEAKLDIEVREGDSSQIRRRVPMVKENLQLLKFPGTEKIEADLTKKRVRYAAMHARKETAAVMIAAGSSRRMAARKAGVSPRQIQKYMEDPDFRERIQEMQETLANRIRGKVIKEVNRRTNPKLIKKMELLDLLRVGDRVGLGRGKDSGVTVNTEINNYESVFNAAFFSDDEELNSDSEAESEDFPSFEPSRLALSGGDSPVDG